MQENGAENRLDELFKTFILGLIQGLTEWLPISSTGHLKIAEHFLNLKVPILLDVTLHVGTLLVVLVFFRNDVKKLISTLYRLDFKTEHGKLVPLIIVGTIPTALIGFFFGNSIEAIFQTLYPIALTFIFCGIFLYSTKYSEEKKGEISYFQAFLIGVAQGIAIVPGISRSGITIAIALLLGIKREKSFRYSFLLSIPAILGAFIFTLYTQLEELTAAGLGWTEIFIGTFTATLVGYLALNFLWRVLSKRIFHLFALYCWLIGVSLLLLAFIGF